MKRLICLGCAVLCIAGLALPVSAAQITGGDCYCFSPEDFSAGDSPLAGICITQLPEASLGTVMLGDRQLRPGDVLTTQQIGEMAFVSAREDHDGQASIRYLPVFANGLSGEATMTLSIRGRENKAPIAEDSAFETYKNLEVTGKLKVREPEGQEMQFALTRQPKRGTVTIREDGSFTYAPKKNKVGVDSFTFTATDSAGKISREATVTVTILKPTDAKQYSDTQGKSCRFAAEWMKNTGIFVGESICGNPCFSPDRPVSRGEFLTMLVKTLNIPTEEQLTETGYSDVPNWLKPYVAAAIRSGCISALPVQEQFGPEEPVTAEDAASLLCAALSLDAAEQPVLSADGGNAHNALAIASDNGFALTAGQILTRSDAAEMMYQISQLPKKA